MGHPFLYMLHTFLWQLIQFFAGVAIAAFMASICYDIVVATKKIFKKLFKQ